MLSYWHRLSITAITWLAWELVCVLQTKSIATGGTLVAVGASLFLPLIGYISSVWWLEEKTGWRRLGITAAGACGAAVGTAIVMIFWS
jgi:hypothetical protein